MEYFFDALKSFPDLAVYGLLALGAFVENLFPPIPGDTITIFGAFLVGTGRLDFLGVYISTTVGSIAGFMFLFWLGSLLGRSFFLKRDLWFFKIEKILRAEEWFMKHGYLIVLLNRFLPGLRSVISVAGGISKLNTLRVSVLSLISSAVWNLIWISAGYALGSNWEIVKQKTAYIMTRYNIVISIFIALIIILLIIRMYFFKKNK